MNGNWTERASGQGERWTDGHDGAVVGFYLLTCKQAKTHKNWANVF